jgi:hypothetical protein
LVIGGESPHLTFERFTYSSRKKNAFLGKPEKPSRFKEISHRQAGRTNSRQLPEIQSCEIARHVRISTPAVHCSQFPFASHTLHPTLLMKNNRMLSPKERSRAKMFKNE